MGRLSVLASALALIGLAPAAADGAETIGSPLTATPSGGTCGVSATFINASLGAGTLQAPVNGVLVRWRLRLPVGGGSHVYRLRVLHPNGGTSYSGAGTGPAQTAPSSGVNVLSLPSPLPISAGDVLGVDCQVGAPSPFSNSAPMASTQTNLAPPVADGATESGNGPFPHEEMLINADFLAKPSNSFSFGKVKRNTRKGTATLAVKVPGPGMLALSGKGVKAARKTAGAAGTVEMLVKPKGKTMGKLRQNGNAKVKVAVTYTPSGGETPGDPRTQKTKVKLIKQS